MITIVGAVAALLFTFSSAPQALKATRDGHAEGLSLGMILMTEAGIAATAAYVYARHGFDFILHSQYVFQFLLWAILTKYRVWPRVSKP